MDKTPPLPDLPAPDIRQSTLSTASQIEQVTNTVFFHVNDSFEWLSIQTQKQGDALARPLKEVNSLGFVGQRMINFIENTTDMAAFTFHKMGDITYRFADFSHTPTRFVCRLTNYPKTPLQFKDIVANSMSDDFLRSFMFLVGDTVITTVNLSSKAIRTACDLVDINSHPFFKEPEIVNEYKTLTKQQRLEPKKIIYQNTITEESIHRRMIEMGF